VTLEQVPDRLDLALDGPADAAHHAADDLADRLHAGHGERAHLLGDLPDEASERPEEVSRQTGGTTLDQILGLRGTPVERVRHRRREAALEELEHPLPDPSEHVQGEPHELLRVEAPWQLDVVGDRLPQPPDDARLQLIEDVVPERPEARRDPANQVLGEPEQALASAGEESLEDRLRSLSDGLEHRLRHLDELAHQRGRLRRETGHPDLQLVEQGASQIPAHALGEAGPAEARLERPGEPGADRRGQLRHPLGPERAAGARGKDAAQPALEAPRQSVTKRGDQLPGRRETHRGPLRHGRGRLGVGDGTGDERVDSRAAGAPQALRLRTGPGRGARLAGGSALDRFGGAAFRASWFDAGHRLIPGILRLVSRLSARMTRGCLEIRLALFLRPGEVRPVRPDLASRDRELDALLAEPAVDREAHLGHQPEPVVQPREEPHVELQPGVAEVLEPDARRRVLADVRRGGEDVLENRLRFAVSVPRATATGTLRLTISLLRVQFVTFCVTKFLFGTMICWLSQFVTTVARIVMLSTVPPVSPTEIVSPTRTGRSSSRINPLTKFPMIS
jgi:hypothetical protein